MLPTKLLPLDKHLDALLDEALRETFPASDPIAVGVELELSAPANRPNAEKMQTGGAPSRWRK